MHRFKTIKRADLETLHKHYLNFEPYSDFNVVSLWGYMVPGAKFMKLGNAIAYEMTDYNTNGRYISILGGTDSKKLITLLAEQRGGSIQLLGVPESTVKSLKDWSAITEIAEDIDNHDYIFSVEKISQMRDTGLREKRKTLKKLERKYPNITVRQIDQNDPYIRRRIYSLFRKWILQSGSTEWTRELAALKREIKIRDFDVVVIGAFDNNKLIGFTVNEIEENGYYQGHFGKANYKYTGLGLLLEVETAQYLRENYGCEVMNLQQDMGIEGIRYYKQSLNPITQLKKYNLTINLRQKQKISTTKLRRLAPAQSHTKE